MSAKCQQQTSRLFDHLVGDGENAGWHGKPSTFAVLRLMTNSNFVGWMTGGAAGFVRLFIRRDEQLFQNLKLEIGCRMVGIPSNFLRAMPSLPTSKHPIGTFASAMVLVLVLSTLAPGLLPDFGRLVTGYDIKPSAAGGFYATLSDPTLSDDQKPTNARLHLIESRRGTALHRFDGWCPVSFACAWFTALVDSNFPLATYEVSRQLGPGGSLHRDIWDKGGGRFSVWKGGVYFSLPDDISVARVKRLELRVPYHSWLEIESADAIFAKVQYVCAIGLATWAIFGLIRSRFNFLYRNVLPGLVISALLLAIVVVGAELYLRAAQMFPVSENRYVGQFVDKVGFTLVPGDTVKWTNGIDFWSTEKINSLGFIDNEPVFPKPAGTFRILLVGDSFVEAAQVPIALKLQTLLTSALKQRFPGRKFDTIALGYSGTGQANQLPFYERNREDFHPDLVILLFVANDFANNSYLLESIRNGWHPDHPPRLFVRADQQSCERLPIDVAWRKFLLSGDRADRAKQIRAMSREIDLSLNGWSATDDLDSIFYREGPLPPAFEAAIASTKCAFEEWKRLSDEDRFQLLVASSGGVVAGQRDRLKQITRDLHLPLIDLDQLFGHRSNPALTRFKTDGHWTPTGHRWAAEAILDYLVANDYVRQD